MNKERLNHFLARCGLASRRHCDSLIQEGRCTVNGEEISTPGYRVDPLKDEVCFDGEKLRPPAAAVIYLFHKPKGYICSHRGRKTIYDLFTEESARLFSVGRLDKDTSGLLLVTNNGKLAQKLIHPSSNLSKEYLVKTDNFVTDAHLKALAEGYTIAGKWMRPASVKKMRKGTIKISLKEGKKHEVRILVANAGLTLLSLKRVRLGNLHLGNLPEGYYKKISLDQAMKAFD